MPARLILISLCAAGFGCGVPQEIFDVRMRELDHCKTDLTRAQSDYAATQKNADELATESSDLRDRVSVLEADRAKLSNSLSTQKQYLDLVKVAIQLADRRADLFELLMEKLRPLLDGKQITIDGGKGRMMIRFSDGIAFDPGRAELRADGQVLLRTLAAVMKQVNRDILVAVHNDNQAIIKGSLFKSGWEITTARAVAIVRFLQGEGVDPRHLGAAGYSEFNFLADNADEAGRALNRRVELVIMPTAEELVPLPPEISHRIMSRTRANPTTPSANPDPVPTPSPSAKPSPTPNPK
jgi:flagellar motor protein MotB